MTMALQLGVLLVMLAFVGASHAADMSKWSASYDPTTKIRFIPIELWTGEEWDGSHELRMTTANFVFGKYGEKSISGPMAWKRPSNGETMQVYERNNKGKKQLFTLSSRGDGLGRVFDSRYERDCVDEVKFPLGLWKENETRVFDVSCNNGALQRKIELTIEKLDFNYDGVPHSLQFHWVVDGGKERGTDMHYIYSPERGLVHVDGD